MKCFTLGGCPGNIITFPVLLSWDGLIGLYLEEMIEGDERRMSCEIWLTRKRKSFWLLHGDSGVRKMASNPPFSSFTYHNSLPQFSLLQNSTHKPIMQVAIWIMWGCIWLIMLFTLQVAGLPWAGVLCPYCSISLNFLWNEKFMFYFRTWIKNKKKISYFSNNHA